MTIFRSCKTCGKNIHLLTPGVNCDDCEDADFDRRLEEHKQRMKGKTWKNRAWWGV